MATQPRQWFRLPSIGRPAPPVTPTPEPPAPQPRPPMFRAPFRPMGQPQPQESTQAPAAPEVSSVPTSPIRRTSVPSSPVPRRSPSPTTSPATTSPPKPQVSAPSPSLPTSPTKPPSTSSMPTSPPKPSPTASPPKPVVTAFSVPTSPPKPAPTIISVPTTSPPKPAPTTFSVPTASPRKPARTTPFVPTSPAKPGPAVTAAASTATAIRVPSPTTVGPRTHETSPQSLYKTAPAPPPSPLILPPSHFTSKAETQPTIPAETEQKTVLVQTSSEKPKSWFNGTGNHFDETHKPSSYAKNAKVHRKQFSSDSDEIGMRVITIAGENKGAFMEVIKSPLKHSFDGSPRTLRNKESPKTQSDGTGWHSFSSSGDEEKSKKDKNHKAKAAMLSSPTGAFMNSNVQGVNNSIVLHSSCSHHDPGVHLSLSRKPSGNGFHVKDKSNGHLS